MAGIGSVMGRLFFFFGVGSLVGPPAMLFLHEASGGTVLPIALVTAVAAVGALVIRPMTRDPVPLPSPADPTPPGPLRPRSAASPNTHSRAARPISTLAPRPRPLLPASVGEWSPQLPVGLAPPSVWMPVPANGEGSR